MYGENLKLMIDVINNLSIQVYSVSVNLESSSKNIILKKKYFENSELFKTFVGIHPEYASLKHLETFNDFFFSNKEYINGIGEIGLDPTYVHNNGHNTFDIQKIIFNHMLDIAEKNDKPVSIHSRRYLKDILQVLTTYRIKKEFLSIGMMGIKVFYGKSMNQAIMFLLVLICFIQRIKSHY